MELQKALIPISEFLTWASISRTQTYREVAAGRLRITKRGNRSFVAATDAKDWLAALNKTATNNEGGK